MRCMLFDSSVSAQVGRHARSRTADVVLDLVARTAVTGASVSVFAGNVGDLVYATDDTAMEVDELQFTVGEGPAVECFRSGSAEMQHNVSAPDYVDRWPIFAGEVAGLGVHCIYAFPLTAGLRPLGVLTLYGVKSQLLSLREAGICRTYSSSLVPCVLADLARTSSSRGPYGFSRADVHVASGILAAQKNVSLARAMLFLRSYAYICRCSTTVVAREVIARLAETNAM